MKSKGKKAGIQRSGGAQSSAASVEVLPCPVVGVGASAGGLEAFTRLLKRLPSTTGLGFVLVQHLDPQHESALTNILSRATTMPVLEVTNNLRIEANHVYIIPPNASLSVVRGVLKLHPRTPTKAGARSIDFFLESLAEDQRERAIGVILSGTASDGTVGLEAIKAEGGITFAQDDSAAYDSMPRSAAGAGCVDFVLSPEGIAEELTRIAKHPFVASALGTLNPTLGRNESLSQGEETALPARGGGGNAGKLKGPDKKSGNESAGAGDTASGYQKILLHLRKHTGVDFSLYKTPTIHRRIARRMVLNRHETSESYADFLRGNATELDALYSDALISVTSFFRNAEAFEVLQRKVFPKLLQQQGDQPLRVWVLGCSTGQEAYSIAMAFTESAEKAARSRNLQVFATDLNEANLHKARNGLYAKSVVQDVSPTRLRRFFVEEEGGFRVIKPLRELVVFARQNLISDPPFSRMDLISCRNLMIYLEPSLQNKTLPTFHYALKPEGFLFLGASESVGAFTNLFEPVDKKQKIFSRKSGQTPTFQLAVKKERGDPLLLGRPALRPASPTGSKLETAPHGFLGELNAEREADRVAINNFAPPGVLINEALQILQFRGLTSAYLEPARGKASFDVLKMARKGLMLPLRAAINRAKKENKTARTENVSIELNDKVRKVNVEVVPLKNLKERCFLVSFEEPRKQSDVVSPLGPQGGSLQNARTVTKKGKADHVASLERELIETRDYLQSVQEQHEVAVEELQASHEESQSANEELQSINEEMETSKEELESTNEELTTVNEEMVNRNTELNRLNSDLTNLQASTKLVIVLLGRDLTLRRFSKQAEKQFNLLPTDVGRPWGNIRHSLDHPDLESFIAEVITSVRACECEVCDKQGRWHDMHVRPYLTIDNKVDGAVLVLVDITARKRTERDLAEKARLLDLSFDAVIVCDPDDKIRLWNKGAEKLYGWRAEEVLGKPCHSLLHTEFPRPKDEIDAQLRREGDFNGEVVQIARDGRRVPTLCRWVLDVGTESILASYTDITARKAAEVEMALERDKAVAASRAKDDFLAALSHELRTPLNPVLLIATDGASNPAYSAPAREAFGIIVKNALLEARLIEDLLDLTKIRHGKMSLEMQRLDIHVVLRDTITTLATEFAEKNVTLAVDFASELCAVTGDPARLQQVFWNVLKNGVKFTPSGGSVHIETRLSSANDEVTILVTDTGIGMTQDELSRVFDAFEQGDHAVSGGFNRFGGLGLGLKICLELVQLHSGHLSATSSGRGCGTAFSIALPLVKEESAEKSSPSIRPRSEAITRGETRTPRRILLVEDHAATRNSLAALLTRRGHEVVTAASIAEALSHSATPFDLLLSDIGLPDGDGCDLMRELHKRYGMRGIAMTGYGTEHDIARSREAGFATHITKPVSIQSLEVAIAST